MSDQVSLLGPAAQSLRGSRRSKFEGWVNGEDFHLKDPVG